MVYESQLDRPVHTSAYFECYTNLISQLDSQLNSKIIQCYIMVLAANGDVKCMIKAKLCLSKFIEISIYIYKHINSVTNSNILI